MSMDNTNSESRDDKKSIAVMASKTQVDGLLQKTREVEQRLDSITADIGKVRDSIRESKLSARYQFDAQKQDFDRRFDAQITRYSDILEKNEARLTELIGKATIGPISSKFASKSRSELIVGRWFLGVFYVLIVIAVLSGGALAWHTLDKLPDGVGVYDALKSIFLRFMACLPLYVPLFWLMLHLNRWAAQKNRLAEEYEHKRLVFESYAGLADQVESLVDKGVATAPALLTELLELTVKVIGFDPVSLLDKVKIQTPIGVAADCVSKMTDTAAKIANAEK